MRLLIINPGSTSTKVSVFDDDNNVFTESVFHDAPLLLSFPSVNEQLPFRKKIVLSLLSEYKIRLESIDAFVGRGGCAYSQKEGVMRIDDRLYEDTRDDKGGSDHPAKLGVIASIWKMAIAYRELAMRLLPITTTLWILDSFVSVYRNLYI